MTSQETARLLILMTSEYPIAFGKLTDYELSLKKELWTKMFENYRYDQVENAFFEFLKTDQKGYPPTAGQLNSIILKNLRPADELDAYGAWELVLTTMSSGEFHYEPKKTFEALPERVQKCIGSYNVMREWSIIDQTKLSYIQSDFIKRYEELSNTEYYNQLIFGVTDDKKLIDA